LLLLSNVKAQQELRNDKSIETGFIVAGSETLFYGLYGKYAMPLTKKQHFVYLAPSLATYFDFKGESTSEAYLKNDVDMRIVPTINPGLSFNFGKFRFNIEVPVGVSVAITKGTLVNEKIGFEKAYSNTEVFFNYGVLFAPKYRINSKNQIGLYAFLPFISDKAQSGYQFGIGWTMTFTNQE
jgi:hypothetical protein